MKHTTQTSLLNRISSRLRICLLAGLSCFLVVFSSADICRADVIANDQYDLVIVGYFPNPGFNLVNGSYGGPVTFDGVAETMGTDFTGGVVSINESLVDNGNDTRTLSINITTTGTDMFPSTDGMGAAITGASLIIGAPVGANLDFVGGPPTLVNGEGLSQVGLGIFGYDSSGTNIWSAPQGNTGAWDGSGFFNLGPNNGLNIVGQGTTSILFEANYAAPSAAAVPEPSSFALLSLCGLGAVIRLRKKRSEKPTPA